MNKVHAHKVGLVFGGLMGIWHAIWAGMVFVGVAQAFIDWIFELHFFSTQFYVNEFSFGTAITLVLVTAVIGYIMGYLLGWLWNMVHKASHGQ